jgi:hypothetical protein
MFDYWQVWHDAWELGLEAQRVISMRLTRIAAGGTAADTECRRMVSEKFLAAAAAQAAAASALASGKGVDAATRQALAPVKRAVRANRRRLSRAKRLDDAVMGLWRLLPGKRHRHQHR